MLDVQVHVLEYILASGVASDVTCLHGGSGIWRDYEDIKRLCEELESMPRLLNLGMSLSQLTDMKDVSNCLETLSAVDMTQVSRDRTSWTASDDNSEDTAGVRDDAPLLLSSVTRHP
ncbi:hypothetical protein LSAT2_000759 [Lamellibrachia satsuma]|nr:hypothetical protein LSAT2_000759 [Lamellibrachia satsuma]